MTDVVRIGAVAHLDERTREDDEPRTLARDAALTLDEGEERDEFLREYAQGNWRAVRLNVFADLARDDGSLHRFDSVHVTGVWFKVPHGKDNERHAQEAADQSLDRLEAHLTEEGFEVSAQQLESVQFKLELDEHLRDELEI